MRIDLQIHTTFSDGHNSPKEIAQLAVANQLSVISVTEHDNVDSYEEVKIECEKVNIRTIPGVEISTTYMGKTIHILGYNFDTTSQELNKFFQANIDFRKMRLIEQFDILNQNLKANGKSSADPQKYSQKENKYFTKPGLALFLKEEGIIADKSEGFQYFKGIIKTVPPTEPKDAIEIIHKVGGKAIFSHPLAPKVSLKELDIESSKYDEIVKLFVEQGLDGLESYGTGHDKEDTERCLGWAKEYNLISTAGSDWHGSLEILGDGIKEYLPFYSNKLGEFNISDVDIEKIISDLNS